VGHQTKLSRRPQTRLAIGSAAAREPHAPDLGELVSISRFTRRGIVALTMAVAAAVGGVVLAVGAVAAPAALRWGTVAVLVALLAATGLLSAHAGGHSRFVPIPAVALAAVWAFTAPQCWLVAGGSYGDCR
jgi:hypothetical protein